MWNQAKLLVHFIDSNISKLVTIDKVKIALYVTWLWAWAGLYLSKAFEMFFMTVLKMPDRWLAIPVGDVVNTSGQRVKIISAKTDKSDITNKLKLFLKLYWEKGGPADANSTNGFDFAKLAKMLNCSMMYCCYLLTDAKGDIEPEQFWDSVHNFLIEQTKNGDCYRSMNSDLSDRSRLWLRNVDFEGKNTRTIPIKVSQNRSTDVHATDSFADIEDELDAYIRSGTSLERPVVPVTPVVTIMHI